tara:strand:- start:1874 stop:2347 length:474 start_codon:yes stop_codon:yes gene_type:complete
MAVIDQNVANKASQDKCQDKNNRDNGSQNNGSQDLSIQDIAERAFNSSYAAVGNVIRSSSKAGVERAISDFQRDISSFEQSFNQSFLQTIETKAGQYEIGTSALRLLNASGVDDELDILCDRNDALIALQESGDITADELEELAALQIKLRKAGLIE